MTSKFRPSHLPWWWLASHSLTREAGFSFNFSVTVWCFRDSFPILTIFTFSLLKFLRHYDKVSLFPDSARFFFLARPDQLRV